MKRECLICGSFFSSPSSPYQGVCSICNPKMRTISSLFTTLCSRCGKPLLSEKETCLSCREKSFHLDRNRAIFRYQYPLSYCLRQYKFNGHRILARFFANALIESGFLNRKVPLIPVPPRRKKVNRKGWDQIQDIAVELKKAGFCILSPLFRRKSAEQKKLDVENRLINSKNAFGIKKHSQISLTKYAHVMILDDVYTTGATVNECARIIKTAGPGYVEAVTICIDY